MGPLVPDVLSDQMNLVLALLLGIAFGFVLEQAGFSSSRKLTGLFYGTDFTVLRVFFTAGVTAMSGVLLLTRFGLLDADLLYINPMFLHSAILGGVIMGVGFVVGGYCPGTSFCGAAVGRVDGMAFAGGGFLGIFAFGEAFPFTQNLYKAGSMGDLLIFNALGITAGQFSAMMIAVAVGAFVVTTKLEKRISTDSPAWRFPVLNHRLAGASLLVLAAILFGMRDRRSVLEAKAQDAEFNHQHRVPAISPDELAFRITDHDPKLQLIDVRETADYTKSSLPGAINLTTGSLLGKEARMSIAAPRTVKVFFGTSEGEGSKAASMARLAGFENVAYLEGGLKAFSQLILAAPPGGDTKNDVALFRSRAGQQISAMISARSAVKPVKKLKKVQGGCGG